MPYDPYEGVYQYIDEQIAFPHQTTGHRPKQPLPRRDIIAAAKHQAEIEARARQRPRNNTLIPPTRQSQGDELEEEFDDEYPPRLPTSARRLNVSPEKIYQSGNTWLHVREVDIPPRRSQQSQLLPAPQQQRQIYTEDIDEQVSRGPGARLSRRAKLQVHWMLYLGIGLLIAIAGWIALNVIGTAWQRQLDDWQYGKDRTYQIDAVVGHSDSSSNPSHFIALNIKGAILVIEIPGGDIAKAISYPITTLPGNQNNPPVKLVFQDLRHTGKVDMLIKVGDPPNVITFMLLNNGTQFVGKL